MDNRTFNSKSTRHTYIIKLTVVMWHAATRGINVQCYGEIPFPLCLSSSCLHLFFFAYTRESSMFLRMWDPALQRDLQSFKFARRDARPATQEFLAIAPSRDSKCYVDVFYKTILCSFKNGRRDFEHAYGKRHSHSIHTVCQKETHLSFIHSRSCLVSVPHLSFSRISNTLVLWHQITII